MARRREATMRGITKLRPKRKVPEWSGRERWEKMMPDHTMAWIDIDADGQRSQGRMVLRNEGGDQWIETLAEVEARRRDLFKNGWLLVGGTVTAKRTIGPRDVKSQVLDAARTLARGSTTVPVRLTALRSRVAAPRSDVDDALRDLHSERKIVLSRDDNTFALTADDREAVFWAGEFPRHLLYLL